MSSKIFVKVESSLEQQENLRNSRKSLKVLQRTSTDKENLVGRQAIGSQKAFVKSKSENDFNDTSDIKRKKLAAQSDRSASVACTASASAPSVVTAKGRRSSELLKSITEEDLQNDAATSELSEGYWRVLAEKRRLALDETLTENQELHDMNASLKEQLDVSNQMLDESRNLVEILTEMLEEGEQAGTTNAGDGEYEKGESSKSFLHASLAEEADEDMTLLANSSDNATEDNDAVAEPTTTTTTTTTTNSDDADDEDSRASNNSSNCSSSRITNNTNDAPKSAESSMD